MCFNAAIPKQKPLPPPPPPPPPPPHPADLNEAQFKTRDQLQKSGTAALTIPLQNSVGGVVGSQSGSGLNIPV